MQAMGRVMIEPMLDDPFPAVDRELEACPLGIACDAVLIDFHAEATSEKMAFGHFCDGRASLVVGTHTHVPTADHQILPGGTAYLTDAGMCGDYDSVIGMEQGGAAAALPAQAAGGAHAPGGRPGHGRRRRGRDRRPHRACHHDRAAPHRRPPVAGPGSRLGSLPMG